MTVAELFSGGQIALQVLEVKGTQVRIGIDAPSQLTILRDDAKVLGFFAGGLWLYLISPLTPH